METNYTMEPGIINDIQLILTEHLREPLPSHPITGHGRFDRPTHRLPDIIIWDPMFQLFNGVLDCPQCSLPLKRRYWKDGKNFHNMPRRLYCIDHPILMVSCLYACSNDHRFLSHDQRVVDSCSADNVPFVLLHKLGFTKKFLHFVVLHITSGLSFTAIEETMSAR